DGDGDGDGDPFACFDQSNDLIPRVLRYNFGNAWFVDGANETALDVPPEGQLTRLVAAANGDQVAVARNDSVNGVWSSEVFMYTFGVAAPLWSQPLPDIN